MKTYHLLLFFFISCSSKKNLHEIIISGVIKGIPARMVYLSDAYKWDTFLDSAEYKNDSFLFNYKASENFEPFVASISFINEEKKIQQLAYENNYLKGKELINTAFLLERGQTYITGSVEKIEHNITNPLIIKAGLQNEIFFKTQNTDFGYLPKSSNLNRTYTIQKYKNLISKYPSSFYLLQGIFFNRENYSKNELKSIFSIFDSSVKKSRNGKLLESYIYELTNPHLPLSNFFVFDINNNKEKIINETAKLNMLIFWASWCGPCKAEIPELKDINIQFKNSGLEMRSISIDSKADEWKDAVKSEQMPWKQFIIDNSDINLLESKYKFSSIPQIIFTDNHYHELKRFSGYNKNNKKNIQVYIKSYLNS